MPTNDPALTDDLIDAAWRNDLGDARRLIQRGADVNAQDATGQSAFLIAASEGYLELLRLTLRNGGDVDAVDSYRGTALIRAAERGHAELVGLLIQRAVEIDHVNRLDWVGLHEALIFADKAGQPGATDTPAGYVDTVRVIVAGGGDLEITTGDGETPLELARAQGLTTQAALLAAAIDAPPMSRSEADRLLLRAARTGDPDAAAIALRRGADIETTNELDQTPLLLAAANDRVAVARLLVAMGADPDAVDYRQDTPWLVTGVTGSVEMAKVLMRHRPDLTLRNRYGGLSPIPAAERGHVGYLRYVVTTDVDLDHVNDLGWTALLEAVILGDGSPTYERVVSVLLRAGADPTIPDADGVTALEHAERNGYTEIARLLR